MSITVEIFRALSDPTRLRIVTLLRSMELSVGELAQVLGQSQPRVSRHVKILCDAGLATRRREGSWVFLVPGDPIRLTPILSAIDQLNLLSGDDHWSIADSARLAAVRTDRALFAERYFADHAEEWDAIRSLHISDSDVEQKLIGAFTNREVGRLVDVGTGTGRMIELFASRATHCAGIDRSPEMLRLARAKLTERGIGHVDLRQGDIHMLPMDDATADTVILHQVLHYLPAPDVAIAELARIATPLGSVVIVDFASHNVEELRDRDAHARLGFSDEQIASWFDAAGLDVDFSDDLPGNPLTVKIWRGIKRPSTQKVSI